MGPRSLYMFLILIVSLVALNAYASDENYGRTVNKTDQWEQAGDKLLTNFLNMYNLHIIEEAEDKAYPFKGWFFGWAVDICNSDNPGCDAIYAARASSLIGPWEVYSGDGEQGRPTWDSTMTPKQWVAVLAGGNRDFHNLHNGDPSVVRKDGKYFMLYSASGNNKDGITFGQPGDTDGDFTNVMAAISEDGLHWTKSGFPVLMYASNWGESIGLAEEGRYLMHPRGGYARPSLMIEDGKFRAWFDAVIDGLFVMLYAENSGNFLEPNDWNIVRGMGNPALKGFPNPEVIKIEDIYLAFGDPPHPEGPETGWGARKITWAASLNGHDWKLLGHMKADAGWQATLVPEAIAVEEGSDTWVYLNYGTMIHGGFFMDSIRMKRWRLSAEELEQLREYLRE